MNQPFYQAQIRFPEFNCLGTQLSEIVKFSKMFLLEGVWYACDIDTLSDNLRIETFVDNYPKKIGTIDALINLAENINQFLSGVFFLMPSDCGDQLDKKYWTDEKDFRDMGNALMEIRAFDTSWYMVYSNDYKLIDSICKKFNGKLLINN